MGQAAPARGLSSQRYCKLRKCQVEQLHFDSANECVIIPVRDQVAWSPFKRWRVKNGVAQVMGQSWVPKLYS